MSTEANRDETLAAETIAAALDAGITVFDTAHAYGRDDTELGHNERLLAGVLRRAAPPGPHPHPRIVTKGGMSRPAGAWLPDGRAKTILRDCEASLAALDGLPIDLYLLHAPDPRTPWRTSLRALARLLDEGMVAHVGVSNVNRPQLDEALELVPLSAVQVALSIHDDRAVRSGVLARCEERGIAVIAHSPLGGPRRAGALGRHAQLSAAAAAHSATPAEVALAWLLELSPAIVAIPGARRPETARSAARAATLALGPEAKAALTRSPLAPPRRVRGTCDVVLIMGIPGSGKSRLAGEYVDRGYVRLNRDERGGALRALADELEHRLEGGETRIVLDNTYLTRAARSYVIEAAARHAAQVRCVWLETPLAQAQVNMVERLLEWFGALPTPEQLRDLARRHPGALTPTQQMRALRELEPPSPEEGFAGIETVPFARAPALESGRTGAGVFLAASALEHRGWQAALEAALEAAVEAAGEAADAPTAPCLLFDWRPDAPPDALDPLATRLSATVTGIVEAALCPHGGGPPRCWCRPPLPGLPLAFAHRHGLDPGRCTLIGTTSTHRALAAALGAGYAEISARGDRRGVARS